MFGEGISSVNCLGNISFDCRDAECLTAKQIHDFAHQMYIELGVWMVVLVAWVNPLAEKRWSMYVLSFGLYTWITHF